MIVIADTSPLHYLILLDHTEVLQRLYGSVIIPEGVVRELQAEKNPGACPTVDHNATGMAANTANYRASGHNARRTRFWRT
jgi:predicted nucleic acid-binding protein